MKRTGVARVAAVAVLAAGALATAAPAAVAAEPSADLLAAVQRDLGLNPEQAAERLRQESRAAVMQHVAKGVAGEKFAGAWFDAASGKLVVGVTDAAKSTALRGLGVEPKVLSNSVKQLGEAKAKLDQAAAPAAVTSWFVDELANTVTVNVKRGQADAAKSFADSAGPLVRLVETDEAPRLFADIRGGDAYYINNAGRCSVGFAVQGGFVTAGHCGSEGDSVAGFNRDDLGEFAASSFPGNDYGWVRSNSAWTPTPKVNGYGKVADVVVSGSTEAAVGASICRSGSTTGWHCGAVQAKNQTVNYQEGSVSGLTRTTVCAEPGDSGGSWVSGTQAQGVTSGGSGNCTSGGTTFFQPVGEILSAYGLSLVTG